MNKGNTSSSVDEYETLSPHNKDTTSSSINSETNINFEFAITHSSLNDHFTKKNMVKPSLALMESQKRNQDY